eukprot:Tbor_TRINITY_DN27_c0_g1::TRINITY_DN27_c0_g1_i1::g.15123::m.15123
MSQSIPNYFDVVYNFMSVATDIIQVTLGGTQGSFAAAAIPNVDPGKFHPETQSWEGDEGLHYRVPLLDLPSERHTRLKTRNIRILMDNVRSICVNDELPCTAEEKKFWTSYRFLKYQLFLGPFCALCPPLYIASRVLHEKLPRVIQGRTIPIAMSCMLAEQWMEHCYPGHELLSNALSAKTPLGDAARAEWQRLQPVAIPIHTYTMYQFKLLTMDPINGLEFGGDIASALE